jgi:hypothetical protein
MDFLLKVARGLWIDKKEVKKAKDGVWRKLSLFLIPSKSV